MSLAHQRPKVAPRIAAALFFFTALASARPRIARFEPTDLDLEETGFLEIETQVGPAYGDGDTGDRILLPDFEIDIGLSKQVELNIDGAFALDHFNEKTKSWEGDPLWTGVKLGIADWKDDETDSGFALGAQVGPRIATIGAKGIGYGALGLFGYQNKRWHATTNLGYFIDPGPRIIGTHSQSFVTGIDFEWDFHRGGAWSVVGALALAYYRTQEPTEFTVAGGFACDVSKNWVLDFMALGGVLPGEDRVGLFMGATPRFFLW